MSAKTFGEVSINKLDHEPDTLLWEISATPAISMRLRRIFPRVRKERTGRLTIVHTREVARDLEWVLNRWPMNIKATHLEFLHSEANLDRDREEDVEAILTGQRQLNLATDVPAARDYQRIASDIALRTGRLLIADDLGLGKTLTGLLALRDPAALPALVVVQTHLPKQWEEEVAKWFPLLRTHILKGTTPYALADRLGGFDPDVVITSYSKLNGWSEFLAGQVNTVIFDEIQELRRSESQKYRSAGHIADKADFRIGLSGTPVYNYGGEIFNIMDLLAPDALGSRDEFSREWGLIMGGGQLGVREPGELGSWLRDQGLMLRRTRKDVGRELPDVSKVVHTIDSDEKVLDRLTGEAIDLAHTILESDDHKAVFTASGEFDNKIRQATGIAKAPYVADFVRMLVESGERVLLFGWHHEVYDIWLDRLTLPAWPAKSVNVVKYTGKESPAAKNRAREEFVNGDADVIMMSLRAGTGLNGLQEVCSTVVFGELDWSPGIHDQCIGRLNRDGQQAEAGVMAFFLVSQTGADPIMADVLNLKRQQGDQIRDPDATLFEAAPDMSNRVRDVAKAFLEKRSK